MIKSVEINSQADLKLSLVRSSAHSYCKLPSFGSNESNSLYDTSSSAPLQTVVLSLLVFFSGRSYCLFACIS